MDYGALPGRYPATVKTYDKVTRTCRVEIPGITDGGDVLPIAEIEYPIGDKSRTGLYGTELEILAGDHVWVAFIGGDQRYPIITGYRNPSAGNSVDWRRYHHANIELTADGILRISAPNVEINSNNVQITGTNLRHNGKNVGSTHNHGGVQGGSSNTSVPN